MSAGKSRICKFTDDLISTWVEYKRTKELDPIRLRPHPHEFYLYYDS